MAATAESIIGLHRHRAKVAPEENGAGEPTYTVHSHGIAERRHRHAGLERASLLPDRAKALMSAGGRKRRGPKAAPGDGDRATAEGYRVPPRYTGGKHVERNRMIVQLLDEGKTLAEVAAVANISTDQVRYIRRYFVDPSTGGQ